MPRGPRVQPSGCVRHVPTSGVRRMALFDKDDDYAACVRVAAEMPMRLLERCGNRRRRVNGEARESELAALRVCVARGRRYGSAARVNETAKRLGLPWPLRRRRDSQ